MTDQVQVKDDAKVTQSAPNTQEQNTQSAVVAPEASKPPEESINEINWRKFRQEREKERKAKEESDRNAAKSSAEAAALKAALDAIVNKPAPAPVMYDENNEETEQQRIQREVKKVLDDERRKDEEGRRQREAAELLPNLRRTFNDFDSVCSAENIDYLEYHYPEAVEGYKNAPDTMQKWTNIYKLAKRFINVDHKKDQAKMEKNLAKPQSMSSAGVTQTGDSAPMELTERRRLDNWNRMQRTLKGVK